MTQGTSANLSRRQFGKNLGSSLLSFALGIVSAFFLTPYWVKMLGVAAYGLVPLTTNLVSYFALITSIVSASVGRFITIECGRNEEDKANRIFNTSFYTCTALTSIVFVVCGIVVAIIPKIISIPIGYEDDARLLVIMAGCSFAISTIMTPFAVATFCTNRIDLSNWLGIGTRFLQIVVSVMLVATVYARPGALLAAALLGTIVTAIATIKFWRLLMPWARIAFIFDWHVLQEQVSYGFWSVINYVGSLLYLQIDLLVINRMVGPVAGGQYAAISQWSLLVRSLGGTIYPVFSPTIMHHFARQDRDGLVEYSRWAVRVMGLMLALPIGLVCGLGQPLLTCWLGAEYSGFGWLLVLIVLHLAVNVSVTPLFVVQQATNHVKVPAVVTCAMGLGNLVLAVALAKKMGMYGVATAGAVMLTLKNMLFTPYYAALILGCKRHTFYKEILVIWALAGGVTAVCMGVNYGLQLHSWCALGVASSIMGGVYCLVAWFVFLRGAERAYIQERVIAPLMARLTAKVVWLTRI